MLVVCDADGSAQYRDTSKSAEQCLYLPQGSKLLLQAWVQHVHHGAELVEVLRRQQLAQLGGILPFEVACPVGHVVSRRDLRVYRLLHTLLP